MGSAIIKAAKLDEQIRLVGQIEANLLHSLAELNEQSINAAVCYTATLPDGELAGGVTGATSYGWLLVKALWVSRDCRRSGIGRDLMAAAEGQAKKLGCHSAWLDTSNVHARTFYARQGYTEFGILTNEPKQNLVPHSRWFMKKAL